MGFNSYTSSLIYSSDLRSNHQFFRSSKLTFLQAAQKDLEARRAKIDERRRTLLVR